MPTYAGSYGDEVVNVAHTEQVHSTILLFIKIRIRNFILDPELLFVLDLDPAKMKEQINKKDLNFNSGHSDQSKFTLVRSSL